MITRQNDNFSNYDLYLFLSVFMSKRQKTVHQRSELQIGNYPNRSGKLESMNILISATLWGVSSSSFYPIKLLGTQPAALLAESIKHILLGLDSWKDFITGNFVWASFVRISRFSSDERPKMGMAIGKFIRFHLKAAGNFFMIRKWAKFFSDDPKLWWNFGWKKPFFIPYRDNIK